MPNEFLQMVVCYRANLQHPGCICPRFSCWGHLEAMSGFESLQSESLFFCFNLLWFFDVFSSVLTFGHFIVPFKFSITYIMRQFGINSHITGVE